MLLRTLAQHPAGSTLHDRARPRWLFPGHTAGQPITEERLRRRLRAQLGSLAIWPGRAAAVRTLLRETPAPIVADLVGFSQHRTHQWSQLAGTNYANYVGLRQAAQHDNDTLPPTTQTLPGMSTTPEPSQQVRPLRGRLRSTDPDQAGTQHHQLNELQRSSYASDRCAHRAFDTKEHHTVASSVIEVGDDRRVRAWARHGTSLTARLGDLGTAFADAPPGSVFDGELVVVSERGGGPVQNFAAVCRAALRGDAAAAEDLRFVAFDVLALGGEDLRGRPWSERNARLTDALPLSGSVRRIESLPASPAAHAAIVALGFEGTVLKRPNSTYRPGRRRVRLKHKARYTVDGVLLSVGRDRDGQWNAGCDVDGRRVSVLAGARWVGRVSEVLTLTHSRVDADGDLREVRIAGPTSTASAAA